MAPIGAGGMGEVYRARDTRLDREVAIKVLPAEVAGDPDRVRRFQQEARAASALNHPNILTIHDVGAENGVAYLVTELLHGETVRDALTRGSIARERAVSIAIQAAHGLAAAHRAGIVHRDLKPENLFITQDGHCKILDFGLARQERPELAGGSDTALPTAGATLAGVVMGTVGYMAPEQVRGQRADARSDLFSFGIVLYEMLTGESPFRRDTVVESLNAILKDDPPVINTPTPLAPIIRRCLEKDPARRFQSASDLAFAIETSSTASLPSVSADKGKPHVRALARIIAVVLVAFIGAFLLLRTRGNSPAPAKGPAVRSLAVVPFTSLSHESSDEYFSAGMTDALTTELSHIAALKVISSHSTARFRNTTQSPAEIAKALGVEALVLGSVLRDGDRVRISAQLSDAATDRVMWAENFERPVSDVLALQGEVTRSIAKAIALELSPAEEKRLSAAVTVEPRALDEYMQGRYLWSQRTEESVRGSLTHFQESAHIAPDFALAYCGIADAYLILAAYNFAQPKQVTPLALEALTHAMELDSTLGEPYATRGDFAMHVERDYALSIQSSDHALKLSPGYASTHNWRAEILFVLGRTDESLAEIRKTIELDPLTPFPHFFLGLALEVKGDAAEAEKAYRDAVAFDPTFPMAQLYVEMLLRQGRHADALAVAQSFATANPGAHSTLVLGIAHALSGHRQEAENCLARAHKLAADRYTSPYDFALLYAALDRRDDALRYFRAAMDAPEFRLPFVAVWPGPALDSLKDDPEFKQMMASLRAPRS
ncbi:MAG TPA: protein kinase [Candidatus Krumholzibacteria bacterium]|nr:protein kinase [Candidatus Krumholzibacteria bacterium]